MRRRALLAGVTVAALLVSGCSGGGGADDAQADPKAALAAAKTAFDGAKFVNLTLTSSGVPQAENGVTGAQGVGEINPTEPKFKGTVTATIKGVGGSAEVITIGDDAWMKFFTPDYNPIDLSTLGAPNPSKFFDPGTGVSQLLVETANPTAGDKIRDGAVVVQQYSGTLPGARIKELFSLGDGTGEFRVTWGIGQDDTVQRAELTGPFFTGATSTYTLRLKDYGTPVEITRP
ncbi:lipoprotein LprG [Knoellia remsis]|uniref:Lipoprotein LprG n=1 Tax=Knoellia remsis TaxID=407159 RepID=A0A2T0UK38_9MICO|nr:LppX_LprAFG lipoprotein [Knoellia remsis]PRY58254.1 lipoprotein LprG [Knoellia remsis]